MPQIARIAKTGRRTTQTFNRRSGPQRSLLSRIEKIDTNQEVDLKLEEEKFCQIYINKTNATEAYMAAFQCKNRGVAGTEGSNLLKRPRIQIRMAQLWEEEKKSLDMGPNSVLREIGRLSKIDLTEFVRKNKNGELEIKDLEEIDGRCVKSMEQYYDDSGNLRVKLQFWSKEQMLKLYGMYHKLFDPNVNVKAEITHKVQTIKIGDKEVQF